MKHQHESKGPSPRGETTTPWRLTDRPLATLGAVIVGGALFLSGCGQALQAPQVSQVSRSVPTANNAVVRIIEDDQWHMKPDIASVPAGKVTFVVINQGMMTHEVVLLKTDKQAKDMVMALGGATINELASGENVGEIEAEAASTMASTFDLAPGHYALICNQPVHYSEGMYADFDVTGDAPSMSMPPVTAAPAGTTTVPEASGVRKEIGLLRVVRPWLENTLAAAQKGDIAGAQKALHQYDIEWHGVEVYLNFRSPELYGELETTDQANLTKLLDDPTASQADIVSATKELLSKWDESLQLMTTSPALSPVFDDLAAMRTLKAETISEIDPMLKAGDVVGAKAMFSQFMTRWADVEDVIKSYSVDAYAGTESAMAKANSVFQKTKPDAAELRLLVADTLANYNFGQNLINAAARNADMTKTTFSPQDVKSAAGIGAIQTELNASLASWKAGNYQGAGDLARRTTGELFTNISSALRTKNNADAPLKKALDAYTAVSDKAGDAAAVSAAEKAAVQAAAVAQQALVGQFWTDPKFKDALRQEASSFR